MGGTLPPLLGRRSRRSSPGSRRAPGRLARRSSRSPAPRAYLACAELPRRARPPRSSSRSTRSGSREDTRRSPGATCASCHGSPHAVVEARRSTSPTTATRVRRSRPTAARSTQRCAACHGERGVREGRRPATPRSVVTLPRLDPRPAASASATRTRRSARAATRRRRRRAARTRIVAKTDRGLGRQRGAEPQGHVRRAATRARPTASRRSSPTSRRRTTAGHIGPARRPRRLLVPDDADAPLLRVPRPHRLHLRAAPCGSRRRSTARARAPTT